MLLPVLRTVSYSAPADFVRLFHQSQVEWFRDLGEETELDFGRWISDSHWLLDAYLPPGLTASQLIEQMKSQNPRWHGCSLNPSMPSAPIGDVLVGMGWSPTPLNVFYRNKKIGPVVTNRSDLTIIPARASYRHYQELMGESALLHLDDSHLDALLALQAGKPVGCVGVLTSGDVGTVQGWHVSPEYRHQGIGQILMDRVLEICVRSVLRHVMIGLPPGAKAAEDLCKKFGFEMAGQWIAFTAAKDQP